MSQKPVLVIMAAGMGSRYSGLKQIDPVDREGDLIIDFSISTQSRLDSKRSYLLSRNRLRKSLRNILETAWKSTCRWSNVYQENDRLPDGFEVPEGRDQSRGNRSVRFSAAAR